MAKKILTLIICLFLLGFFSNKQVFGQEDEKSYTINSIHIIGANRIPAEKVKEFIPFSEGMVILKRDLEQKLILLENHLLYTNNYLSVEVIPDWNEEELSAEVYVNLVEDFLVYRHATSGQNILFNNFPWDKMKFGFELGAEIQAIALELPLTYPALVMVTIGQQSFLTDQTQLFLSATGGVNLNPDLQVTIPCKYIVASNSGTLDDDLSIGLNLDLNYKYLRNSPQGVGYGFSTGYVKGISQFDYGIFMNDLRIYFKPLLNLEFQISGNYNSITGNIPVYQYIPLLGGRRESFSLPPDVYPNILRLNFDTCFLNAAMINLGFIQPKIDFTGFIEAKKAFSEFKALDLSTMEIQAGGGAVAHFLSLCFKFELGYNFTKQQSAFFFSVGPRY